jgi:trimeric autotransporter adhesin
MATTVTVSLAQAALTVGQTMQATARVTVSESDGLVDARPIAWASSAPAIASVSASGLVTAMAAGSATIRATVDGVTGTSPLSVSAPAVPVATVDAAVEAVIKAVTIGKTFILKGPTMEFTVQVNG